MEPAKRLAPTAETVRRLFLLSGNQCAFPECTHPIITEGGTYVGEICHVCAAEAGGERFDPLQSNEERRAFENLLLMCHDHHVVTDDVREYPVARMREIKSTHEQRFVRGLASMMETASVQIVNSTISLGGEGGKAPGAGGGGGGAIGPGARGGQGGGGGESVIASFRAEDLPDTVKITIGQAGRGGTEGHGDDGGDTTFGDLLRAKGGKGGKRGEATVEAPATRTNAPSGVRISSAFLANHAEVHNGLFSAIGCGWSAYLVNEFPSPIHGWFVLLAEVTDLDHAEDMIEFAFELLDGDRTTVAQTIFSVSMKSAHRVSRSPYVLPFWAKVSGPGIWMVRVMAGNDDFVELPFEVKLRAPTVG